MSRRDAVLLASRVLAVFFMLPALIGTVMLLPERGITYAINSAEHGPGFIAPPFHWNLLSLMYPLLNYAIRIMVGYTFWKGGPAIERLLLPTEPSPDTETTA